MNNDRLRLVLCAAGGVFFLVLVWGLFQHRWCSQAEATSDRLREQAASASAELAKSQKELDEQRKATELKGRSVAEEKAKSALLEGRLAEEERVEKELRAQLEKSQPKEKAAVASNASTLKGTQNAPDKAVQQAANNAGAQQAPKSGNDQPSASTPELQKAKADLDAAQQTLTQTKNLYNTLLNEEHAKDAEIARLKETGTKVWNDLANANKEKDALTKEVAALQAQITTLQNQLAQARKSTATKKN